MYKAKVETIKQLDVVLSTDYINDVIISRDSFSEKELPRLIKKIIDKKKKAWILLERISRYEEIKDLRTSTDNLYDIEGLYGVIVQNLDQYAYLLRKIIFHKKLKVELNYTMNCYNIETKKLYEKLFAEKTDDRLLFTAPIELNHYEIDDVGYDTLLVYGYIDTMVTANCLKKNILNKCIGKFDYKSMPDRPLSDVNFIKDRKNKNLYYKNYCKYCYNKIFNVEPLYILDICDDNKNNINYRFDFTIESEKETIDILQKKMPKSYTRGHYKNSIN